MKISEALENTRYVVDAAGNKTAVLIPLEAWKRLLAAWQELTDKLEDQEDRTLLQGWLEKRAGGEAKTVSLEALEHELIEDGLLPNRD